MVSTRHLVGRTSLLGEGLIRLAFTAYGRSDHVTMISPPLRFTVCNFSLKVNSIVLAITVFVHLLFVLTKRKRESDVNLSNKCV